MMSAEPADDLAAAERLIKLADAVVSIDHTVMTFSVGVPAAPDYPSPESCRQSGPFAT